MMRQRWRAMAGWRPWTLTLAALAALALGGCGGPAAGPAPAATVTITPLPTATPFSGPEPVAFYPGCPGTFAPTPAQTVMVGGLQVSIPQRLDDMPSALMPSDAPNAPYKVPLTLAETQGVGAFHPNPVVNPLGAGYVIELCNTSGAPRTLNALTVTIASFTPSSGPVSVWHICQGGPYDAATGQTTPGCGGGFAGNEAAATFTSDAAGATVAVTGAVLPATIPPGQSATLLIFVKGLTAQGTYALNFGVTVAGDAGAPLAPSDGSFLIAPNATVWTGATCSTAAMKAQIPAATTDTYYVCPPAQ